MADSGLIPKNWRAAGRKAGDWLGVMSSAWRARKGTARHTLIFYT